MTALKQFLIFYGIAGFVIGGFVSAMDTVNFSVRGKPFRYPRLAAFLVCGLIWPVIVLQMISWRK